MVTDQEMNSLFEDLTDYPRPREFQRETIQAFLEMAERSRYDGVLLRAPTGSGKMEAAISPFLFAHHFGYSFPKKLIYTVPLRTLANSLRKRTQDLVNSWLKRHPATQNHPLLEKKRKRLLVTLQTGENPEDPRFEGDIIFCTIDQLLSSFLNIPYSVGRGSANVNAGAIFASYLVFDEIHSLAPDRPFATVLELLRQVKGISPCLLMTATLTETLSLEIQEFFDRVIKVEGNDLKQIQGDRQRSFTPVEQSLSTKAILADIEECNRKRVIVICNTVSKSQGLFRNLENMVSERGLNIEVILLHSRFKPSDRAEKEAQLLELFKKGWQDDGKCYVLISTQAIEVGINITCEVMHSRLAPMNSLLQRAGRCARFAGESGEVLVYRAIAISEEEKKLSEKDFEDEEKNKKEDKTSRKRREFLPYKDSICEKTWEVLKNGDRSQSVDFTVETEWIDAVHQDESIEQQEKRQNNQLEFWQQFENAVFRGDKSAARHLIRFIDSRNIYAFDDSFLIDGELPTEIDPRYLEAFSVPVTMLLKAWTEYNKVDNKTWLFKRIENPPDRSSKNHSEKKSEGYNLPTIAKIESITQLCSSFRILVNPQYIFYNKDIGLWIDIDPSDRENRYISDRKLLDNKKAIKSEYQYHLDTYIGHLGMMWTCWRNSFEKEGITGDLIESKIYSSVQQELADAGGKFIQQKIFPDASLEDAIALFHILVFFAILTHDLGKLQKSWQDSMRGWQEIAHKEFGATNPKNFCLAHTDYNPINTKTNKKGHTQKDRMTLYQKENPRPPHAIESAFLAQELFVSHLWPILEGSFGADEEQALQIIDAIAMAAGRHHSAWTNGWLLDKVAEIEAIALIPHANAEIQGSWDRLSKYLPKLLTPNIKLPLEPFVLKKTTYLAEVTQLDCFTLHQLEYQQLYSLVVRALRLCDGRSVQLH